MIKAKYANSNPYLALLDLRSTPTEGLDSSPTQVLLSRRTETLLPIAEELLMPGDMSVYCRTMENLGKNKEKQARYDNKGAKKLGDLKRGDAVRIEPIEKDKEWIKARVEEPVNIRSYRVET